MSRLKGLGLILGIAFFLGGCASGPCARDCDRHYRGVRHDICQNMCAKFD